MAAALTSTSFTRLLACLDPDHERAGEKYEDLRRTLIKFFEWRNAPFPEDHTDETFNRVARKLDEGTEVKNIGGYCYEVARFVCMEVMKSNDRKRDTLQADYPDITGDEVDGKVERERRLDCLDQCLSQLPADNRSLIVEYYKDDRRDRIDRRKALAETLGLQREALANRAQRLRDKLEMCVTRCCNKKTPI